LTPDSAIANVRNAFRDAPRPGEFIRGTCRCEECLEHNQTMASHTPDTISMKELGNPGWDPICFANDQAFAYYLPAMIRLAFGPAGYACQLLFHLSIPERAESLTARQAAAVMEALRAVAEAQPDQFATGLDKSRLAEAMGRLGQVQAKNRRAWESR
jgi:hypothetical protein